MRTSALVLVALLAGCRTGAAVSAPRTAGAAVAPRQITAVEGITEYALGNGMRVLLFPDPSKDTVTVNVTYLVGSRHEGYGETGMAHLLEHMMFKGTPTHPKVWDELGERGANNNASTWYDRTNYYETLPAGDEVLTWALAMEADRMTNSRIAEADLRSEFSVVRNEFESGENDPNGILTERMWSTAFLWHNYGKSTIGSRVDIERVPAARLRAFYRTYYRPDNAVLIVAGKFEPRATLASIDRLFGAIARPAAALPVTYTVEPAQDGERTVTLRRTGDVQLVGLLYHGLAGSDPDFVGVQAIADALGAEPSGRLYRALVATGLATHVSAGVLPLHDPGALEIDAAVPVGTSIDKVRDTMIQVVEGLRQKPVTADELARFVARQKKAFRLTFADSEAVATGLSEWMAMGDWRLFFLHRDQVERVSVEQVAAVAGRLLVASNRTVGTFVPTDAPVRAPIAVAPDVPAIVRGYTGKAAPSTGEVFDATIDNIERRTQVVTFDNSGLKLALLPRHTRGDAVHASVTLRFGSEADVRGQRVAAELLGALMVRGTRRHDFQALQDEWDRLEAELSVNAGPGELQIGITTVRDRLPEVLALVDEVLRQAALPASELAVVTREHLTALEATLSDPEQQSTTAMRRALTPYPAAHPLYVATTAEEIAETRALSLAAVRRQYALLGMSDATIAIVGSFDAPAVNQWIEQHWAGWKSPRPYRRIEPVYAATKPGELSIDTPDKENAIIVAGYALPMRDDDPDYPALLAANHVLGGGGFASRMMTRLRQKDGLSYWAYSYVRAEPFDKVGFLMLAAILAPQNAGKGMSAVLEEIDRLVSGGVSAAELDQAKRVVARDFARSLADDGFVVGLLDESLHVARPLAFYRARLAAIAALTPARLNGVIKKYLGAARLFRITGGDAGKMSARRAP